MVCPKCGRRTFKREAVCPKCGAAMPERKSVEIISEPTDSNNINHTEGESDLSLFNRKKQKEETAAVEPTAAPTVPSETDAPEIPAEPTPSAPPTEEPAAAADFSATPSEDVFVPELEFKPAEPSAEVSFGSDSGVPSEEPAGADMSPEFYGSYGEVCNDVSQPPPAAEPPAEEPTQREIDFSVLDFDIPDVTLPAADEKPEAEEAAFAPMPNLSDDDDELVLPDIPVPASSAEGESKKSMGYETTVKLENARTAYGNQKPINEPIKTGTAAASGPKRRDFTVVASGTAHVSGDLPKLKEGEMYVAVTPKELRRLRSRKFRGLGVVATLCLVIISAFCIWNYAHSFADPLVGVWKGDVNSAYIPVEQIQQMNQELIDSTWEFSSSGSLYLNIVVNETPISLSGSYQEKKDGSGEPYLSMTLTNPMDSSEYTLDMYYTITGEILEFNDMEGIGMTIDLTKE